MSELNDSMPDSATDAETVSAQTAETMTAQTDTPDAEITVADENPGPSIDMDAVQAASEAHDAAVTQAHLDLHDRMQAAYATFKTDLDSAWKMWENLVRQARTDGPEITEVAEDAADIAGDATRAV